MKLFLLLSGFSVLTLSASDCNNKKPAEKYKGRLEIAGICMNYTIRITEGTIDTAKVSANWTDEVTNKSYTNVFRLGSPCDFPSNIQQGDEFYFIIDTAQPKECMVCMAYYPTPPRSLNIKVVEK
jgi:hypothetical protein